MIPCICDGGQVHGDRTSTRVCQELEWGSEEWLPVGPRFLSRMTKSPHVDCADGCTTLIILTATG